MINHGIDIPPEMHLERELADYATLQNYIDGFEKLLVAAREHLPQSEHLAALSHKLGIECRTPPTQWEAGPGQVFYGISSLKVELAFFPRAALQGGKTELKGRVLSNPSSTRMFRGPGWKDVFIIPFYDLPGRIRSICGVGRKAGPEDVVYKRVLLSRTQLGTGVACHPAITTELATPLLCVDDPIFYLKMQASHFTRSNVPLPLVLWADVGNWYTSDAWKMFATNRKLFLATKLTPQLLRQALLTDGEIYIPELAHPGRTQLRTYLNRQPPSETLAIAERQAKPWQEVLAEFVTTSAPPKVEGLFLAMDRLGFTAREVLLTCSKETANKVTAIMHVGTGRAVSVRGRTVEERPNGWYTRKRNVDELVSEAKFTVDKVIVYGDSAKTFYQGTVEYGGKKTEYCTDRDIVERATARWLQDLVLRQLKALPRISQTWKPYLLDIATQFDAPEVVTGVETVGWDNAAQRFQLPQFQISSRGKVTAQDHAVVTPGTPGWNLRTPSVLGPADLERFIGDTRGNRAFWAAWLAMVANIIAQATVEPTRGIVVAGRSAVQAARIVKTALGVVSKKLTRAQIPALIEEESLHNWPLAVGLDQRVSDKINKLWLEAPAESRNCVTRATEWQAMVCRFNGGWHAIIDESAAQTDPGHAVAATILLPAYLQYYATNGMLLDHPGDSFLRQLVADVVDWLKSLYVEPDVVLAAEELILPDPEEDAADVFGEIVCRLLQSGELEFGANDSSGYNLLQTENGIFIPRQAIHDLLEAHDAPVVTGHRITQQLLAGGRLRGEERMGGLIGWTVDERWLASINNALRQQGPARLRVVGGEE